MIRLMSCLVVFGAIASTASALTVCHDFTWYKITRADGDNLGKDTLITRLQSADHKYKSIHSFMSNDAKGLAKGQRYLRPGDVVVIGAGNGHSGIMTANGIDHFIQIPGEVGQRRDPMNLPRGPVRAKNANAPEHVFGGHFMGDTLAGMIGKLSGAGPHPVSIYSKVADLKIKMTWNTRTDVDLWVEEPGNVKCWYQNNRTTNGGHLHQDNTTGFGPEHYELARAEPGNFVIKVNYYSGPRNAKVEPTTVTVEVVQFEGTPNARTQRFNATLNNRGETATVHTVRFE